MNIKNIKGFTLVELAIVLVIVGVLAGTFLTTLGSRIDTTRRADTLAEMEVIKQALYGYALTNNFAHLPCPDCRTAACALGANVENDGISDITGNVCDVDVADANAALPLGNLPWRTLGLGYGDSWGNHYSYWATSTATDDSADFALASWPDGEAATINTRVGAVVSLLSNNAVAIIMSHGKNGFGATNTQGVALANPPAANVDELENVDDNLFFVSRVETADGVAAAIGAFDDLIIWISEYELKAKMVAAGQLP